MKVSLHLSLPIYTNALREERLDAFQSLHFTYLKKKIKLPYSIPHNHFHVPSLILFHSDFTYL